MPDREKVIKALENCNVPEKCRDCPWEPCEEFDCKHSDYPDGLIEQALALLKAQEPRVMTLEEYKHAAEKPKKERDPVWEEWPGEGLTNGWEMPNQAYGGYGTSWRCWTSRPTDDQMEATPWE